MDHGTFPERFVERARRRGDEIALREKKYGIWQEVTWREYAAHVRASSTSACGPATRWQ